MASERSNAPSSTSGAAAVETPKERRAALVAVTALPIVVVIAGA